MMRRVFLPRLPFPQSRNFILVCVILVLLVSLLILALPAFEEPFEEDDTYSLEIDTNKHLVHDFYSKSDDPGTALGLLSRIFRLEYLKGHIGEKRPVDSQIKFSLIIHVLFWMAALAHRAAFLLSYSFIRFEEKRVPSLRSRSIPLTLPKQNTLFNGGL